MPHFKRMHERTVDHAHEEIHLNNAWSPKNGRGCCFSIRKPRRQS